MRDWQRIILAVGVVAGGLLAAASASAYCAICQTALANSPEGQQLAGGLNSGVLFLLSVPFLVAGTILFLVFRSRVGAAVRQVVGSRRIQDAPEKLFLVTAGKDSTSP
ncbi:MAG: hypothetical protein HYS38_01395 [Acidobacteria bacterium]|nr:hypothetical protein [Acidobacteriota bacterium]